MEIIAHRGACKDKTEENTPLAFRRAVILGFPMLELDARLTKDGYLITHHDPEVFHQGRKVVICDHLLEDLSVDGLCISDTVRFGQSKKIPALELVLDMFLRDIKINVELKEKGSGKVLAGLLKKMSGEYRPFQSGDIFKRLLLSSFEESELVAFKKNFSEIEIEMAFLENRFQFPLFSIDRKKLDRLQRLGIKSIHLPRRKATRELVDYLKYQQGFSTIRVFTVNDQDTFLRCLDLGVNGVFTDKVEALRWMKPAHF